jgi:PAS domain S-box-containing protein
MGLFADFKLKTKLNLILSTLLVGLFLMTAFLTYRDQQALVQNSALEQSRGVAKQVIATTDYMSEVVRNEPANNYGLVPQVVATQVAKRISQGNQYTVRQISLNYRNPDNRPDAYEAQQLKAFRGAASNENYQIVTENGEEVFRYMQSMIAEKSCLECHGDYASAPPFIQKRYPPEHPSYNYKVGEVLGAVSVSRPMSDLYSEIGSNLKTELLYRVVILALVFATVGILTRRFIIDPIRSASATIHKVATTGDLSERIQADANQDEIGQLIDNFNEMMAELGRTTLQRQESESRYQSLIEAMPAAIVTFLKDGKIVISNHEAGSLFDISRHKLIGESFFDFFEDGAPLRSKVEGFTGDGTWPESGSLSTHTLRIPHGKSKVVNVALILASNLDHVPMFTALITGKDV